MARLRPGLGVILWSRSSIPMSAVAPAARLVARGDLLREKILKTMTMQIMNVKKRLIANGDVLAMRVLSIEWVSFLGEIKIPLELLNPWQLCLTLLRKLLLTELLARLPLTYMAANR